MDITLVHAPDVDADLREHLLGPPRFPLSWLSSHTPGIRSHFGSRPNGTLLPPSSLSDLHLCLMAPLPPIGASGPAAIDAPCGVRTQSGRSGRHRGIYWRPPCSACGRGAYRSTHALAGSGYVELPVAPVPSSPSHLLATSPWLAPSLASTVDRLLALTNALVHKVELIDRKLDDATAGLVLLADRELSTMTMEDASPTPPDDGPSPPMG